MELYQYFKIHGIVLYYILIVAIFVTVLYVYYRKWDIETNKDTARTEVRWFYKTVFPKRCSKPSLWCNIYLPGDIVAIYASEQGEGGRYRYLGDGWFYKKLIQKKLWGR